MFQISKSLALIVNTSDSEDANAEMQTIADVWARSIVSGNYLQLIKLQV